MTSTGPTEPVNIWVYFARKFSLNNVPYVFKINEDKIKVVGEFQAKFFLITLKYIVGPVKFCRTSRS